jgi:G6PDH family F420-dependent oxidoreductase
MKLGYALSSEEHGPLDLVRYAAGAEQAGFEFALISDHFHPWIDAQGHSAFVWSVLGGISQSTSRLNVGTGVTSPTIRMHPAIVAQAAATAAEMLPGRFFLGVGSGEALNEHILGDRWPSANERRDMLEEAIELMRALWGGKMQSFDGAYYTLVDARLYTVPAEPVPVYIAADGKKSGALAARIGDGLIATAPKRELIERFTSEGRTDRPRVGQIAVCWHEDEAEARRIARKWWPTAALRGELSQELPLPRHFEQATSDVTEDQLAERIICGPDLDRHLSAIREYVDAGFDHVYVHQIGPDQEGFFRAYERQVMPELGRIASAA